MSSVRAVVQRVSRAAVRADGELRGAIGAGLLVLLGVEAGDGVVEAERLAGKTARLLHHAMEPLETELLHPARRPVDASGDEVERRTELQQQRYAEHVDVVAQPPLAVGHLERRHDDVG